MRTLLLSVLVSLPWPGFALVGGAPTQGFPSVFIWTTDSNHLHDSFCTGSKLGPSLIVTAAHCVLESVPADGYSNRRHWDFSEELAPGKFIKLAFARHVYPGGAFERVKIRAVHFPPVLEAALSSCRLRGARTPVPDIAVIEIEKPSALFLRAPAVRVSARRVREGELVLLLGFGHQQDRDSAFPRLKAGLNRAFSVRALYRYFDDSVAERDGFPVSSAAFGAPGPLWDPSLPSLGSGDSGGPVLRAFSGELLGINSDGYCPVYNEDCQIAGNSVFTRIDNEALGAPGRWLASLVTQASKHRIN